MRQRHKQIARRGWHTQQINQGMQRNRVKMTRINIHISVERNSSSRRLVEVSNSIIIEKQRQLMRMRNIPRRFILSHAWKRNSNIPEQRVWHIVDTQLSPSYVGFPRGCNCRDALFTMRTFIKRTIEHDTDPNILLVFVDHEKRLSK